jgi:hypothetical protein
METDYLYNSVKETTKFLDILRNVGRFKYRQTINLSNQELDKLIEDNQMRISAAVRDSIILYNFVESKELATEYEAFHANVMAKLKVIYEKEKEAKK